LIAIYIILNSFFKDFSFLTLKNTFVKSFKGVQFTPSWTWPKHIYKYI